MTTKTKTAFRIERTDQGAVLWFDIPDSKVNVLRPDVEDDLSRALDELEADPPAALVIASAKEEFCVGADVNVLNEIETSDELAELSRQGQAVMNRIESLPFPTVAAISGNCLGGGLELALACDRRVAADTDDTKLGLPEVQLGLVPGAGGTVRLPETVGLESALDMILAGKRLRPSRARKVGLVDDVVHPKILLDVAFELAGEPADDQSLLGKARDFALAGNPVGRKVVFSKARDSVME
ncbi:MAG: fatty acid oxidation complex subunit alpha FadJ, partial [Actinobacteria bacterium]